MAGQLAGPKPCFCQDEVNSKSPFAGAGRERAERVGIESTSNRQDSPTNPQGSTPSGSATGSKLPDSADLQTVVNAWPDLAPSVRLNILALIESAGKAE